MCSVSAKYAFPVENYGAGSCMRPPVEIDLCAKCSERIATVVDESGFTCFRTFEERYRAAVIESRTTGVASVKINIGGVVNDQTSGSGTLVEPEFAVESLDHSRVVRNATAVKK